MGLYDDVLQYNRTLRQKVRSNRKVVESDAPRWRRDESEKRADLFASEAARLERILLKERLRRKKRAITGRRNETC